MRLKGTYDNGPKFISLIDGAKDVDCHYFQGWMYKYHPWDVVEQSDATHKIVLNDNKHTQSNKYCRKGDIYLSKGHHVEIVVKGGVYYTPKGVVK